MGRRARGLGTGALRRSKATASALAAAFVVSALAAVVSAHSQIQIASCAGSNNIIGQGQGLALTASVDSTIVTIGGAEVYFVPGDALPPDHDTGGWGTPMLADDGAWGGESAEVATLLKDTSAMAMGSHQAWMHAQSESPGVWSDWCVWAFLVVDPTIDTTGPAITATWFLPDNVVDQPGEVVTLMATADDTADPGTHWVNGVEYWVTSCGVGLPGAPLSILNPGGEVTDASALVDTTLYVDGVYTFYVAARDSVGNWGPCTKPTGSVDLIIARLGDPAGPDPYEAAVTPSVKGGGAGTVNITATLDDRYHGASNITAAEFFADPLPDGTPNPGPYAPGSGAAMAAADGAFDRYVEDVTVTVDVSAWAMGSYRVYLHGRDEAGRWGPLLNATFTLTIASPVLPRVQLAGTDVLLSWDPPPTGNPDHYNVYVADSVDQLPPASGALRVVVPGTVTSWGHAGAAADGLNHFYLVRSADPLDAEDPNGEALGKFVIPLVPGVNEVSVPLILVDKTVPGVLAPITGLYESVMALSASGWQWYNVSGSPTLPGITHTLGLRILMRAPASLPVVGRVPGDTAVPLRAGWNFVGLPRLMDWAMPTALQSVAGLYRSVLAYDPTDPFDPWKQYAAGALSPEFRDLTVLRPGMALWINTQGSGTWSVLGA